MANLGIDFLILALRIAVVFLLYLFLYQVVRVITRELRSANADIVPASQYGYLTVVNAGPTGLPIGKKYPLNQINSIGRAMTNDIPLDDTFLSGEHAVLEWDGNTWVVEDLQSTNGSWLNGRELDQPMAMSYGDVIQVGHVELKLSR